MHKVQKNGRKKCGHYKRDITLQDFADSKPGNFSGVRQKKGEMSKHIDKKEVDSVAEIEEPSWYDKDLNDFDITMSDSETEDNEESAKNLPIVKKMKRLEDTGSGVVYPVDVWFHLSRFIFPETVTTFALLCRGTNAVVHTVQFWKTLYLRYYCDTANIPEDLRHQSLDCIHGLRAKTIRMLYLLYQPFVNRTKTTIPFENEPHSLVGQRCLLTWHKKMKNVWSFYFKFRKGDDVDLSSNQRRSLKSRNFEKWHRDLHYNPENNCSILEVTCPGFTPLPMVMGLILNGVYLNVSHGSMRYHRLKLVLDTNYRTTTKKNQMCMHELVLDPVLEVRVYPWWHPNFTETQSIILSNET